MRPWQKRLLLAVAVFAAFASVTRSLRNQAPPPSAVAIAGSFTIDGGFSPAPASLSLVARTWGSWSGNDANKGTLRIGPFPAPETLSIAFSGYPAHSGNEVYLEMPQLGIKLPLTVADIGEHWEVKEFSLPLGWRGWQVVLIAVDQSETFGGWLGISDPLKPKAGQAVGMGFGGDLLTLIGNGVLLFFCLQGALRLLASREWLPSEWRFTAACALVAVAGYGAFWAYFFNRNLGVAFSLLVIGAGFISWMMGTSEERRCQREYGRIATLTFLIGLGYLAILHFPDGRRSFYDLAATRFTHPMPGDNRIPHDVSARLFRGESLKNFAPDWLVSDRPPLQSGWQLLTLPATSAVGIDEGTASATSSLWFALIWVGTAYGLLRNLGSRQGRALAWCAVMAMSGFFVLNSVYTWPKLAGGAFTCTSFCFCVLSQEEERHLGPRFRFGLMLGVLGWLCHGGTAFSILAMAPFVIRPLRQLGAKPLLAALVVVLALSLPWMAFQRFYDPPGNRLLKWHLAGQIEIDPRGTIETLRDSYLHRPLQEHLKAKAENIRTLLQARWPLLFSIDRDHLAKRQADEFHHTARALTWWLLGFVALAISLIMPGSTAVGIHHRAKRCRVGLWTALTLGLWCLLMFQGGQSVIHQGSYAALMGLFVLLSVWIDRLTLYGLPFVAALQAATLVFTWCPLASGQSLAPVAVALALLSAASVGASVFVWTRTSPAKNSLSRD